MKVFMLAHISRCPMLSTALSSGSVSYLGVTCFSKRFTESINFSICSKTGVLTVFLEHRIMSSTEGGIAERYFGILGTVSQIYAMTDTSVKNIKQDGEIQIELDNIFRGTVVGLFGGISIAIIILIMEVSWFRSHGQK